MKSLAILSVLFAANESAHWFLKPEWVMVWVTIAYVLIAAFTLFAIWRQANIMQQQTKAMVAQAGLMEDTAKRQLRAYFGTVGGKLYIRDDGTVEPRITFINCGQTPAYDLQVIECGRFETRPFKGVPPPDQNRLPSHAHVIGGGQPYYFTCRKVPYEQGKESLLRDLSFANYAFILNGLTLPPENVPHIAL
jgi:hypothetical protein